MAGRKLPSAHRPPGVPPFRHLAIFSDTHAGSSVALCPPGYRLEGGQAVVLSPAQLCLWAKWREFWSEFVPWATAGEPFAVLDNGDCCEGLHHGTAELLSPAEIDHIGIAVECRRRLRDRAAHWYTVRGTPAHAGTLSWREEAVARLLATEEREGPHSLFQAVIPVGEHTVHAAHHISGTSSPVSEFSALAKEMTLCMLDRARYGGTIPDLIVRSHIHQFKHATLPAADGRSISVATTPAWQLKTEFAHKHFRFGRPQVGGLVVSSTDYGLTIRRFLWVPPDAETPQATARKLTRATQRRARRRVRRTGPPSSPRLRKARTLAKE